MRKIGYILILAFFSIFWVIAFIKLFEGHWIGFGLCAFILLPITIRSLYGLFIEIGNSRDSKKPNLADNFVPFSQQQNIGQQMNNYQNQNSFTGFTFCDQCGFRLVTGARFCPGCGAKK